MASEVDDALRSETNGAVDLSGDLISVEVSVELRGATPEAQEKVAEAVQAYAERLALESEDQEISNKPDGVRLREISANSVVRAREVLSRHGTRSRKAKRDIAALACASPFGVLAGVFGSNLDSAWHWAALGLCLFLTVAFSLYIAIRRLR